jgi:hypothetical protein
MADSVEVREEDAWSRCQNAAGVSDGRQMDALDVALENWNAASASAGTSYVRYPASHRLRTRVEAVRNASALSWRQGAVILDPGVWSDVTAGGGGWLRLQPSGVRAVKECLAGGAAWDAGTARLHPVPHQHHLVLALGAAEGGCLSCCERCHAPQQRE